MTLPAQDCGRCPAAARDEDHDCAAPDCLSAHGSATGNAGLAVEGNDVGAEPAVKSAGTLSPSVQSTAESSYLREALEKIAEIECHAEEICDCKRRMAREALAHTPHPNPSTTQQE